MADLEPNRLSKIYRYEKADVLIKKVLQSGVIDFLEETLKPDAIVLFGSVQRGVYHKESDIDLFVQTGYKRLDLRKYEKKIGHEIHIIFEKDFKKLSKGFLGNIYNGLTLSGRLGVLK